MKNLIILLFLISALTGYTQTDQKAKSILDQVSQKTKGYKSISADFQFIMDNSEVDLHEVSRGSLVVQGDAYKLTISGAEILCDGKTQWTFMKEANEVSLSNAESDDNTINPATIFTIYEQGFKNSYLGEFITDSKRTYKIELVPEEVKEFSRVILEIDQTNFQIIGAVMDGTEGNKYTIKVTNMSTSKEYPASTFVFDQKKHPNVDVVDMR